MKPRRKIYPKNLITSLSDESTDQEVKEYGQACILTVLYQTKFGGTFLMKPDQQN